MNRRIGADITRPAQVVVHVDGEPLDAYPGESVAVALLAAGIVMLRASPRAGTPRGAFCHMGVCQECLIWIDGERTQACSTPVREGMQIQLRRDER